MEAVGTATSLQQLHFDFQEGVGADGMCPKLFGHLSGLRQLKDLSVIGPLTPLNAAEPDVDDAMHLSALTGLTYLDVCSWRCSDVAAVALACHLSQLQQLRLTHCGLESKASLPAIAKLVQLRHLDLSINVMGIGDCLKLLTQLSGLTYMQLYSSQDGRPSEQEWDDFWAAVRGQQS
jgi:hypothetical protein